VTATRQDANMKWIALIVLAISAVLIVAIIVIGQVLVKHDQHGVTIQPYSQPLNNRPSESVAASETPNTPQNPGDTLAEASIAEPKHADSMNAAGGTEASSIVIQHINSKNPDYVLLRNTTPHEVNIGGHMIIEDNNTCLIPNGTIIEGHGKKQIFFFSRKKPENQRASDAMRGKGELVCDTFGISTGEIIQFVTDSGEELSRKRAP
jgi:hypothetical protein